MRCPLFSGRLISANSQALCGLRIGGLRIEVCDFAILGLRAPAIPVFVGRCGCARELAQNAPLGSFGGQF
eukprot:10222780-Alexandrium_andersonii.AAC.1